MDSHFEAKIKTKQKNSLFGASEHIRVLESKGPQSRSDISYRRYTAVLHSLRKPLQCVKY